MNPNLAGLIAETAVSIGMDPRDLAAIISFETGGTFDPMQEGPTTKWGTHRGLIQFGEPQAAEYGVDWSDPVNSQLGPDGAIANYFIENGWQPGMGTEQAYSIVNAGGPDRLDWSDEAAGGTWGTVGDKVKYQFADHFKNADGLLGSVPMGEVVQPEEGLMARFMDAAPDIAESLVQTNAPPEMAIMRPISPMTYTPQRRSNPYLERLRA